MKEICVEDIVRECGGTLLYGSSHLVCGDFEKDDRKIKKGDTFVGIKGENFDGNTFFEKALEKGAKVCILQGEEPAKEKLTKYQDIAIVMVKDTIEAIGKLAAYKRSLYKIPVVAVTGSVGKTSTKDMIASVVAQKYKVKKTQGNFNNHIGLPFTILSLKDEEALVVEMGMNHFGEIRYLTKIAKPTIAVITNIGTSHIGNLGSRENILKAKLEILEGLEAKGRIVINEDNDLLHSWHEKNKGKNILSFGIEEKANLVPYNIQIAAEESQYCIDVEGKTYQVKVPISGKHFIYNSCAAMAVGRILSIPMEQILQGIATFELTKKRMETILLNNGSWLINDSYNASLDSMVAALSYLKEVPGKRKIAVLGDMLELGEYAETLHREVGKEVVKNKIDILLTVGTLGKLIADEAEELGMKKDKILSFENNQEIILYLKEQMQKGDIILLKASNAMKLSQIAEELQKED